MAGKPLRIAVAAPMFPKLSETFVLDHIVDLVEQGHKVSVIAGDTTDPPDLVHEDVALHGLATLVHRVAPAHDDEAWADALRRSGDHDVFHCHFGPVGNLVLRARQTLGYSGRIVVTFHGFDISRLVREKGPGFYRNLFRHGDLFLPVSDHWRHRLIELGCPPERVTVHPMGVDPTRFAFIDRDGRPSDTLQVLSVGRLVEKKGFKYGIRAVARCLHDGIGVHYRIIGDGPLLHELKAEVAELGVAANVEFLDSLPRAEVTGYMAHADVLLTPSVTSRDGDQEGIPVVIMEAMASGLPVVATVHTGIPELVRHRETGLLAPEKDVARLAALLATLAGQPELRLKLGRNGRSVIEQERNVRHLHKDLVRMYHSLLETSPPAT